MLSRENLQLDAVLNYTLPIETIVERLGGRRTCSACKAVFHVTSRPPKTPGICDHCQGALVQREDDKPEAIRVRMEVYEHSTKPLIQYYSQRGLLQTILAEGTPEQIYERTLKVLVPLLSSPDRKPVGP